MYLLMTRDTQLIIDGRGYIVSINVCGEETLSEPSPLFTLPLDGKILAPLSAKDNGDVCRFDFGHGLFIDAVFAELESCVTVEVAGVSDKIEAIMFGPVRVRPAEVVGEVVGVVQGGDIALGMMALNIKTCSGAMPETDIGAKTDSGITTSQVSTAAAKTEEGAVFCFHTRRRDRLTYNRVGQVRYSMTYPLASDDPDAYIPGAKLAIFGSERNCVLERIGEMELETGLPHPLIEGEWNKTARADMKSYIISNFGADDADTVIDAAMKAGIDRIYQEGPFETWGEFKLGGCFNGDRTKMRELTEKAKKLGIRVGAHCLTNFITTNDPFVTPVPNEHLCAVGELELCGDIDEKADTVTVRATDILKQPLTLNAVKIGTELLTYSSVAENGDTCVRNGNVCVGNGNVSVLNGVKRGAFGTAAATHSQTDKAYLLWDYPYRTLFPDIILQDEMADNLADFFIDTGVSQISFDGLEGCNYTGHGDYACDRFVTRCYDKWGYDVISDGSNLHHYAWHIHNYMNWGEPWGEAMRSGQISGRMRNQDFFRRNLFPRMFGWILMRCAERKFPATTPEDIEWAMSMSAGYDAGFALSVGVGTLKKNGMTDVIMNAIKNWDTLRIADAFSDEQRQKLRDVESEWHLEKIGGGYDLYPLCITKSYTCDLGEMQPGQPGGSDWQLEMKYGGGVQFRLYVEGDGEINAPIFKTPTDTVRFDCTVHGGEYLCFSPFDNTAVLTDKNYNVIENVTYVGGFSVNSGVSAISFGCTVSADERPEVSVRFITRGEPEQIIL